MADARADRSDATAQILAARVDACQEREADERLQNREDHKAMFGRIRNVEIQQTKLSTRVGMWAAGGAILATLVANLALKFIK